MSKSSTGNDVLIDWDDFTIDIGEGTTIALSRSRCSNAESTLLMFPGYTSKRRNSTNVDVTKRLARFGVQCIVADLSGHGGSTGSIEDQTVLRAAGEISALMEHLRAGGFVPPNHRIAILANSFSANAAILAASDRADLSAVVLKSPVVEYVPMRVAQLGEAKMAEWRSSGFIRLDDGTPSKYSFIEDALKVDTYKATEKIRCPIMAVHGSKDADIPTEQIERFRDQLLRLGHQHTLFIDADHGITGHNFKPCMQLFAGFLLEHLGLKGSCS